MANLFLALILISIAILIAGASADVRFVYTDSPRVSIDFLFFTLLFYTDRERTRTHGVKRKAGFFERIKSGIRKTKARGAALDFLLRNSRVTVHSINIPIKEKEPSELVIKSANLSSLILIIFTYLSLKAEKMALEDDDFLLTSYSMPKDEPTLDFTLRTTVYIILSALVIYLLKIRERSVKKNVRNQNE